MTGTVQVGPSARPRAFGGRVGVVRADWLVWTQRTLGGLVLLQTVQDWSRPGWRALLVDAPLRLPMPGLDALQLHGLLAMQTLYATMAASALCLLMGFGGRLAPLVLAGALLVDFAQDATLYLNHHYLLILLALVAVALPRVRWGEDAPSDALWLVRFQLAVPYVFAGVAKLDPDWFTGRVMQRMLDGRADTLGALGTVPGQAVVMSWSALLLDLFAPLALWLGPGRTVAWSAMVFFHLTNSGLYPIGVFPWAMLALTPTLLPDDTLRRMGVAWRQDATTRGAMVGGALACVLFALAWSMSAGPVEVAIAAWAGAVLGWLWTDGRSGHDVAPPRALVPRALPRPVLATWVVVQLALPMRHWVIPGDVAWTEQGHRYAWRMLLRTKRIDDAWIEVLRPQTGQHQYLRPDAFMAPYQRQEVLTRPDLAQAFASVLAHQFEADGAGPAEVRMRVVVSLNGHPPALLYDPTVDLVRAPSPWWSVTPWVRPTPRRMWW